MRLPEFVRPPNQTLGAPPTTPSYRFTDEQWQELRENAKGKKYFLLTDLYFSTPECLSIEQTFWSLWGVMLDRVERPPTHPKSRHGRVCMGFTMEQLQEWQRMLAQTPDSTDIGSFRQQVEYRARVIRARKHLQQLDEAVRRHREKHGKES